MTPTYLLIRPVLGFWEDHLTTVAIPAGAKVNVATTKNDVGLCAASWDGRIFMAFIEDIRRNGIISGESLGGFTHTT